MKALLLLGNTFDFQVLLLTECMVHGCLFLVVFTLFFMETFSLFQSVCTSDLVNAKAPGAFGTKPHTGASECSCLSMYLCAEKSLHVNNQA